MATEAQIQANRANAQKSTGPRTAEGKAIVAQNAVTHGLLAQMVVIRGEDPGQFDLYRDQMLEDLAPAGPVESVLAERIVNLSWRLQRAQRLQGPAFDLLERRFLLPGVCPEWQEWVNAQRRRQDLGLAGTSEDDRLVGRLVARTLMRDFTEDGALDRLLVQERRIEHSLYRTMAELRKVQGLRERAKEGPDAHEKEAVRDMHPTDSTLDNPVATSAAPEDQSAGAPTNTRAGPACETKPIGVGIGVRGSGIGEPTSAPQSPTPEPWIFVPKKPNFVPAESRASP